MDMMRVTAIALIGALALLLFKQYKPDWGMPLRLVLGLVLGGLILSSVSEILSFARDLSGDESTIPDTIWQMILKALGLSFITELASGICRDSGEGSLAVWVEMAGKVALLLLALPLIKEVLLIAREFLGVGG